MTQEEQSMRRQEAEFKVSELSKYIDALFVEGDRQLALSSRSRFLETCAVITFLLSLTARVWFDSPVLLVATEFAELLFWLTMIRGWLFFTVKLHGVGREIEGCFRTLEILGYMEERDGRQKKGQKYRVSWLEKVWEWTKQNERKQAFGMASVLASIGMGNQRKAVRHGTLTGSLLSKNGIWA